MIELSPLPSYTEQLTLLDTPISDNQLIFPQEVIDIALKRGSNVQDGKFRIYEQLANSLDTKTILIF